MTTKKTAVKKGGTKVYLPIVDAVRDRLEAVRSGIAADHPALAAELTDVQLLNTALSMAATASKERVKAKLSA